MPSLARLLLALAALALLVTGCVTPPHNAAKGRDTKTAVWKVDHAAGLAVPHCPECDTVVSRLHDTCLGCGVECRIMQKTVDCPECAATGDCSHCGTDGTCIPCAGAGQCGICEGSGEFEGSPCPECEGARVCQDCAGTSVGRDCEYCEDSRDCANCGGDGAIELR